MRFGRSKRRLNQLQAQEIARQGVGQERGALRDALTVFDENALLLQAPDGLWQALSARDWQHLFVRERDQWAQVRIEVFGHALLEKLVQPYVAITGHAWRVMPAPAPTAPIAGPNAHAKPAPTPTHVYLHPNPQSQSQSQSQGVANADAQLDAWLCNSLQEDHLRRKAFAPLPVLGVPGWWSANQDPSFYAQTQVFRAARTPDTDNLN